MVCPSARVCRADAFVDSSQQTYCTRNETPRPTTTPASSSIAHCPLPITMFRVIISVRWALPPTNPPPIKFPAIIVRAVLQCRNKGKLHRRRGTFWLYEACRVLQRLPGLTTCHFISFALYMFASVSSAFTMDHDTQNESKANLRFGGSCRQQFKLLLPDFPPCVTGKDVIV